ncbi:hypothetical protein CK203_091958 [Vitis vinifera]|uniref:Uncharacterized protein n=1 Tax=Vitis vinifera TaxID=29760 RepID=A0A438DEX6_VITVI|nr:hypothetical protein CK203_091958 [Vitis vinifera]
MDMGFGGLLQLGCKELRYELITWIIANYDIGYHRLCMHTNVVVLVTPQYVREVLGIPNNGMDILIYNRRNTPNRTYDIQILEDNMQDGIRDYRNSHLTYIRDCVLFLQFFYMTKFYMTYVQVEVRTPLCASWIDDQIKRRLAAEIQTYGKYGHVQVIQGKEPVVRNDAPPYEPQAHIPMTPPRYCYIHGAYITWDELSSHNGGRWVNSVIIGVVCRMLNVE